jgi:hypothetical protein
MLPLSPAQVEPSCATTTAIYMAGSGRINWPA